MSTIHGGRAAEALDLPFEAPGRIFQMWAQTVSHSRILLRSPRDERALTRIDLLFKNVDYVALPTRLPGLKVRELSNEDAAERLPGWLRRTVGSRAFDLVGPGYIGVIVAGSLSLVEDSGEYFEPSALWRWQLVDAVESDQQSE